MANYNFYDHIGFYVISYSSNSPSSKIVLIHKVHDNVRIAGTYSQPIEFTAHRYIPAVIGYKLINSYTPIHILIILLWMMLRHFKSTDNHCGYKFSWSIYGLLPFSGTS